MRAAGATGPQSKVTARGFNPPKDGVRNKSLSGGPSQPGPSGTHGGTSSPTSRRGPGGLGLTGSRYPRER